MITEGGTGRLTGSLLIGSSRLLYAYVVHLEHQGKQSDADSKGIFERHVLKAARDLASRKEAEALVGDFVSLLGKLIETGKGRTGAKCPSILRAAYSLVIRSRTDPGAPPRAA